MYEFSQFGQLSAIRQLPVPESVFQMLFVEKQSEIAFNVSFLWQHIRLPVFFAFFRHDPVGFHITQESPTAL